MTTKVPARLKLQLPQNFSRLALAAGLLLGRSVDAAVSLPFYEPFPSAGTNNNYNGVRYIQGEFLGTNGSLQSGQIWTFGESVGPDSARINSSSALSYPGLSITNGAYTNTASYGLASHTGNNSAKDRGVSLTIPSNPAAIYSSCLLNVRRLTNNSVAFWGLTTSAGSPPISKNGALVFLDYTGSLRISKNSSSWANSETYALTTNTTHLLVIRYKYNPGAPDQVDLWVDPAALGDDANIPAPTLTTTNNANLPANYFDAVAYYQDANPSSFFMDEIHVATNWADVTPTAPPPGNLYNVTGGGAGCPGDSFVVGLSGSDTNILYQLYKNGVLFPGQFVTGTGGALSFGALTNRATYSVLATNFNNGAMGWMNGKASITDLSAPSIDVPPQPVSIVESNQASFTVTASGSGLTYQWFRNTFVVTNDSHVSGAQTTNLVISPATAADAATDIYGYSVRVTDQCGSTTYGAPVALTVSPLPPTFNFNLSGNVLALQWPTQYLGWKLQTQTRTLATGLSPSPFDWLMVPGSAGLNQTNMVMDPTSGAVFFRLVSP